MDFFWSDLHLNHEGIISVCNRPFKNCQQQKLALIKNYNKVVSPEDTCYFLGDVYFGHNPDELGEFLKCLGGKKVLILGNHDEMNAFDYVRAGFWHVHTYYQVQEFHLLHDPSACCLNRNEKWLVGHLHNTFANRRHDNWLDVGVDGGDFIPYSIDECRRMFL